MNNLSFRHYLFLHLLDKLRGDRTVNSVYHILTGKKSSQTIQDIKWYGLKEYFRMFPSWKEVSFHRESKSLYITGFYQYNNQSPVLTSKGLQFLENFFQAFEWPPIFDGWKYGEASVIFWRRLSLFIQSLSFSIADKPAFLPVFQDLEIQRWVKARWPVHKEKKREIASELFKELYVKLEELSEKDAMIFSLRLSGYGCTGLTYSQVAEKMELDVDESVYRFQAVLHYLLHNANGTIYIKEASDGLIRDRNLTETARKTSFHLRKGLPIDEIASERQLKPSTIEDHLVELASEDATFPVEHYVDPSLQKAIIHFAKINKTFKLKTIKESLEKEKVIADYFSIRLVLAYHGSDHGYA